MAITPKNLSKQVRRQQFVGFIDGQSTAGTATAKWPLFVAPYALTVTAIKLTAQADISGADTNSFTSVIRNAGTAGSGTTSLASQAFTSGNDATALVPLSLTVSNADVAAGDVLVYERTKVGTGLASPAFAVQIEYEITDQLDRPE